MSPRRCATLDRVTVTPLYPRGSHTSSPWPPPESVLDHAVGRFMTHDLADYHFSVHADVHDIDVIFVDEHDEVVNPLGAKGLGEIGVVGVAAAIANAIYHATEKEPGPRALASAQPGVEHVAQRVAEHVESEHRERDRDAGPDRHPRRAEHVGTA